MNRGPQKIDLDWDGSALREWREKHGRDYLSVAASLGISPATLYRYESGIVPPLPMANRIVAMTRGAIRYRDMYRSFRPEYA